MSDFEIIETMVGVPIDALLNAQILDSDSIERIEAMRSAGQESVDLAEIAMNGGYQIVIIPVEEEEEDEDEEDDHERSGLAGLLDRLRNVFGKAMSFEVENKLISQNRRKIAARTPHNFERAIWSTRDGIIRCRVCGSSEPVDGAIICSGVAKGMGYGMSQEDMGYGMSDEGKEEYVPMVPLGELTLRSAVMAETNDMIADAIGCWSQASAHYFDQSEWVDEGIACQNCVAYCPEMSGCHWVEGEINAVGICKLWVIPEENRFENVMKMIVRSNGKYEVRSADGSKLLGTYSTKQEAEARLAEIEYFKAVATKTENGKQYPSEAFAYVPDPERPSTWKLRLWESPDLKETAGQVGMALAAMTTGFRGNKVQIPAGDLAGVKTRVRAAWKKVHAGETLPDVLKAEMFTPPKGVQEEAKRAVNWIEQGFQGQGFTPTGRRRASDLAAGKAVSYDIIQRIDAFLTRHRTDRQSPGWSPGEKGYPSPGRVAWAAWGGDAARSWVNGINSSMAKDSPNVSDVHVDVPMGSGRKKKNPVQVAPTVAGLFSKSDDRQFTLGPWYVPDSYDAHGEWTDSEELQSALWDYVRNGDRQIRLQHNVEVVAGEWVEALTWPYPVIVPMTDASTGLMIEQEFPAGTVFMGVVWEDWAWELVKEGKIRGYSMGGSGQRVTVDLPPEGQV